MGKPDATYLDKGSKVKNVKIKKPHVFSSLVLIFVALFVGILTVAPALIQNSAQTNVAQADDGSAFMGVVCSGPNELGMFMSPGNWQFPLMNYTQPGLANRQWTGNEAFANNTAFPVYQGEGGVSHSFVVDIPKDRAKGFGNIAAVLPKLQDTRNFWNCTATTMTTFFSSSVLNLSSAITSLTQAISVLAFDSNIICKPKWSPGSSADPLDTKNVAIDSSGMCFNLVGIIGGNSASTQKNSLIGLLTSSVYMPMIIIVVAIAAFWVLWIGIVKRRFREAMFDTLWVLLSVVFGLALLLNPALIARAPMVISNSFGSCIIGAFTGNSCWDGSSTGGSITANSPTTTTSDKICKSTAASATPDQQMSMIANGMSCSIWKAFILEPYSQGNFGQSFESLDATNPTLIAAAKKAKVNPKTLCISMSTSASVNQTRSQINFNTSSKQMCNLAAYQLFLSTNAKSVSFAGGGVSQPPAASTLDKRWYNVILTAANDDTYWSSWAPGLNNSMYKLGMGFGSLFTSVIGGLVIVVIGAFALMYYIISIVLMAFAPLFFLIGIHPQRGKKILLGWLEHIVSYILKYLASAFFLIVTLAFYNAVLGGSQSIGLTLIFVLILSLALLIYRNEIVGLIGRANMGGQKISGSFAQKAQTFGMSAAGGAVGGALATGANPLTLSGLGSAAKGAVGGANEGIERELKRGTAGKFTSVAAREADRARAENKRLASEQMGQATKQAGLLEDKVIREETTVRDTGHEIPELQNNLTQNRSRYEEALDDENRLQNARVETLQDLAPNNELFAQAQGLINRLDSLRFQRDILTARGDTAGVRAITDEIKSIQQQATALNPQINAAEFSDFKQRYDQLLDDNMKRNGLMDYTEEESEANRKGIVDYEISTTRYENTVQRHNEAADSRNSTIYDQYKNAAKADIIAAARANLAPGHGFTKNDLKRFDDEASRVAAEKVRNDTGIDPHMTVDDMFRVDYVPGDYGNLPSKPALPTSTKPSDGPLPPI